MKLWIWLQNICYEPRAHSKAARKEPYDSDFDEVIKFYGEEIEEVQIASLSSEVQSSNRN